jgi:hypothetical protein
MRAGVEHRFRRIRTFALLSRTTSIPLAPAATVTPAEDTNSGSQSDRPCQLRLKMIQRRPRIHKETVWTLAIYIDPVYDWPAFSNTEIHAFTKGPAKMSEDPSM